MNLLKDCDFRSLFSVNIIFGMLYCVLTIYIHLLIHRRIHIMIQKLSLSSNKLNNVLDLSHPVFVCSFTGHRPQNLPFRYNELDERCVCLKRKLRKIIIQLIEEKNVFHFITGMAIGIDMYAAEIVIDLKLKYPYITLEAAIPCETQSLKWSKDLQQRYWDILKLCDKKTLIQSYYSSDCMQKRNRYMVDKADVIVAVWDGTVSGTGMTVKYAISHQKPVLVIDPNSLLVTVKKI